MPPVTPPSHLRFADRIAAIKNTLDALTSQQQIALGGGQGFFNQPVLRTGVLPAVPAFDNTSQPAQTSGYGMDVMSNSKVGGIQIPLLRMGSIQWNQGSPASYGAAMYLLDHRGNPRVAFAATGILVYNADGTFNSYIVGPF